jgi:hypothetical protein
LFDTGGTPEGDKVQQWDKSPVANHEAPTTKQFLGAGTMRSGNIPIYLQLNIFKLASSVV